MKFLFAIITTTAILLSVNTAEAQNRGAVIDRQGDFVRSFLSGNCVRTKWELDFDPCAPKVADPEPSIIEPLVQRTREIVNSYKRNFLAFFDFDKATLTDDARLVILESSALPRNAFGARYTLTGHTDRAGSSAYNMRLSERRAAAVKAELQRLGIGENAITVRWRGEEEPLVATEDNIKEPQNRRVEIQFEYDRREVRRY